MRECEINDAYYQYGTDASAKKGDEGIKAFIPSETKIPDYAKIVSGIFTVEDVKTAAKKRSLTITEYLSALLIHMLISCSETPVNLPVRISVPIDLRRHFPSETVRNFAYMAPLTFSPDGRTNIDFDEICNNIRGELAKGTDIKRLLTSISGNVNAEKMKITSAVPVGIKKAVLKKSYKNSQESYSLFFSKLGILDYPPSLAKHIKYAETCLGETPHPHFGCAAVSVNGIFTFTFSSAAQSTKMQKFFFRFLAADGIKVRVTSNIPAITGGDTL